MLYKHHRLLHVSDMSVHYPSYSYYLTLITRMTQMVLCLSDDSHSWLLYSGITWNKGLFLLEESRKLACRSSSKKKKLIIWKSDTQQTKKRSVISVISVWLFIFFLCDPSSLQIRFRNVVPLYHDSEKQDPGTFGPSKPFERCVQIIWTTRRDNPFGGIEVIWTPR